jgi:cell division septation protein DedD
VTDLAPWGLRNSFAVAVFNERIWLTGGWTEASIGITGNYRSDVWCSSDGVNWSRKTAQASWSPRIDHALVAHAGKLYVLGGYFLGELSDVWSSGDGEEWSLMESSCRKWDARDKLLSLSFGGSLWVLGGDTDDSGEANDVWASTDGKAWTRKTAHADWQECAEHSGFVEGGRMWVVGGNDRSYYDESYPRAWNSVDGVHWSGWGNLVPNEKWVNGRAVAFGGRIWVIGGDAAKPSTLYISLTRPSPTPTRTPRPTSTPTPTPKCTRTPTRTPVRTATPTPTRTVTPTRTSTPTHAPKPTSTPTKNPTATSTPTPISQAWIQATAAAPWKERYNPASLVFQNKIWVIGGYVENDEGYCDLSADVWHTFDGANWTQVAESTPWGPRDGYGALSFGGKMWILGGLYVGEDDNSASCLSDIWYSSDGVNWTPTSQSPPFLAQRRGIPLLYSTTKCG